MCPLFSEFPGPVGTSSVTEDQMMTMSPTAAAISKIKPGMKLTEVYATEFQHPNKFLLKPFVEFISRFEGIPCENSVFY